MDCNLVYFNLIIYLLVYDHCCPALFIKKSGLL